jgi:hypothetical protein
MKETDAMRTLTMTTRTQDEILAKIREWQPRDLFGFKTGDLIGYLDYEHAKEFLKEEVTADTWQPEPNNREAILLTMLEYMPFAWEKANGCRGISAGRSLAHYTAWIWMIEDEAEFGNLEQYEHYGKEHLRSICAHYGWNADQWDDGERLNSEPA